VDSLQEVGGGGNVAGVSVEDKILAENKEQTAELRKLNHPKGKSGKVGDTTGDMSGAFGGKGEEGKVSNNTLLTSINGTLLSILSAMVGTTKATQNVGTLVTTRG